MSTSLKSLFGESGAVKSIQRGIASGKNIVVSVTISPVNVDKCVVILYNKGGEGKLTESIYRPSFISLTETKLTVKTGQIGAYYSMDVFWQIVEYY